MQQVPAGIQAQKAHPPTGVCHVCFIEDYTDDNLLLEVRLPSSLPAPVSTLLAIHYPQERLGAECSVKDSRLAASAGLFGILGQRGKVLVKTLLACNMQLS